MIGYAITITGGTGPHLRITYTDTNTDNLTIGAGTYYILGDGSSTCLLQEIEDLILATTPITSCSVALHGAGAGRVLITTGGTKHIDKIDSLTTHITPKDLGYVLDATTEITFAVLFGSSISSGLYRCPSLWIPSTSYDLADIITRRDRAVGAYTATGTGVVDHYAGHSHSTHILPEVWAALVRLQYAADAGAVANVPGMTSGDTHAALEGWLDRVADLLGGAVPLLRWTPDVDTAATHRSVRITDTRLYEGVEAWIELSNEGLNWHDLSFRLSET
jgi:hypothetical protein